MCISLNFRFIYICLRSMGVFAQCVSVRSCVSMTNEHIDKWPTVTEGKYIAVYVDTV